MATAKQFITFEYTLHLSEAEANYLVGLLQNYLGRDSEPPAESAIRQGIWHALCSFPPEARL